MNTRAPDGGGAVIPWILAITVSVHLLGSAVLFGILGGPLFVLASPLLSVFGWFFLIPEFLAVSLQWSLYDPVQARTGQFWLVMALSILVGALLMGGLGPKEEGHVVHWTVAYLFAGGAAAAWSLTAILFVKRLRGEKAVRNGRKSMASVSEICHNDNIDC
jgi:hypothetical protein